MPVMVVGDETADVGFSGKVTTGLREQMHAAAVQAVQEVFDGMILPEAKALCPVLTGRNRDSIAVTYHDNPDTGYVSAWLQTHSGYGWLIEHGTSRNRQLTRIARRKRGRRTVTSDRTPAQPYLFPAVSQNVEQIPERARQIMEGA